MHNFSNGPSISIVDILSYLIYGLIILVLIDVIIANLRSFGQGPSPYHPAVRTLRRIVDPMEEPFRRMLPPSKTGGWDLSPMFVMLLLSLLRSMLMRMH